MQIHPLVSLTSQSGGQLLTRFTAFLGADVWDQAPVQYQYSTVEHTPYSAEYK